MFDFLILTGFRNFFATKGGPGLAGHNTNEAYLAVLSRRNDDLLSILADLGLRKQT